jgi:hypothetical protein
MALALTEHAWHVRAGGGARMSGGQRSNAAERVPAAQRDEALAENERLRKAGKYLYAALRFYVPDLTRVDYRRDPFFKDAHMAIAAWEAAMEECPHG